RPASDKQISTWRPNYRTIGTRGAACAAVLWASEEGRSMRNVLTTVAVLFLLVSGDALAGWHEASSVHFVIYADESEKEIRKYSDRLERYFGAMTFVFASKQTKPSPSNRVT